MPDQKISQLTAGGAAQATDLLPVARGATNVSLLAKDIATALERLAASGQSLTGTQATSLVDLAATWNTTGTPTAIKLNVTDTASNAASLLMDLQVGGASRFAVAKSGTITTTNVSMSGWISGATFVATTQLLLDVANQDVVLRRDAAQTLAQRNSTNAQTYRLYRSFTDASNYSRLSTGWSSSTALIATEGAGTGSRGNIAFGSAALATSATVGYVMIPSCAGAPTGVPADIPTGQVALHYDTTNNKLYVYNGSWRSTAALT